MKEAAQLESSRLVLRAERYSNDQIKAVTWAGHVECTGKDKRMQGFGGVNLRKEITWKNYA